MKARDQVRNLATFATIQQKPSKCARERHPPLRISNFRITRGGGALLSARGYNQILAMYSKHSMPLLNNRQLYICTHIVVCVTFIVRTTCNQHTYTINIFVPVNLTCPFFYFFIYTLMYVVLLTQGITHWNVTTDSSSKQQAVLTTFREYELFQSHYLYLSTLLIKTLS
jgi:hypothetical protein